MAGDAPDLPPGLPAPWLKVCVTCDRQAAVQGRGQGRIGEALADAIGQMGTALAATLRRVPCLSGCRHPGNVALGGGARCKMRLHDLRAQDAADVVALAARYARAPAGHVPAEDWPPGLRGKLAVIVPPR